MVFTVTCKRCGKRHEFETNFYDDGSRRTGVVMADDPVDDRREYDPPEEYGRLLCPNCDVPMEYFQFNGKGWWNCSGCDGELEADD